MAKLKQEQETSDLSRGSRQACFGAREGEKGSGEADGSISSHWVKRRPRLLELQLVCLSRIGLYGQSSCCNPTRDQNLGIHSLVSRNTQKPTTTHLIHYSRYQKLRDCIDSQPLKLRRTAIAGGLRWVEGSLPQLFAHADMHMTDQSGCESVVRQINDQTSS